MNQTTIFDMLYPKKKITKPIRLIEMFSGYGSQALALKYLGVPFEHWKICEWAIKSIQAYKDIHFTNNNIDYSQGMMKEWISNWLKQKGISSNYNEPMTRQQIDRLNEKQIRRIYNNIFATHNLVNIQQVHGEDLEIVDTDKYEYIMTYSFPCQDLSLAGKGKGMSDTSTRSGMLWEVERILTECHELGDMPQILLMENVPQVHSEDNLQDFNKWKLRLEELGYKNYWQDLIATDYGIPQTRNRCFMVSLLGDYSYTFPKLIPLKLKLKDMLEDNVNEKYYLSDKQLESLESGSYNASKPSVKLEITDKGLCQTLDTMSGENRQPLVRVGNKSLQETLEQNEINETCYIDTYNKRIDKDKIGTITTGVSFRNNTFLAEKIKNNKKLVNIASDELLKNNKVKENDVLLTNFISRRIKEDDIIQNNNISPTLTRSATEIGVVVDTLKKELCNKLIQDGLVEEGDVVKHSYTSQILDGNKKCVEKNDGNMITLTTRGDCVGTTIKDDLGNLRIRKLTPKECFRLMGVKDEDFEKCAKNQSDSSLYHLAGDSIVVNVLMAIFKNLKKE